MSSSLPLLGTRALVTGATSPIGRAISHRLSALGASLILISRKPPADFLSSFPPPLDNHPTARTTPHEILPGDVSSSTFWTALAKSLRSPTAPAPPPRILINAAAQPQSRLTISTPIPDIDAILATNLRSIVLSARALVPLMRPAGGVIVNVSSLTALRGTPGSAVYAASKAGILGFQRSAVGEYSGWGVRMNTVVPGYIEGGMTAEGRMGDGRREEVRARVPLGRLGRPEEVASVVEMCVLNEYLNGAEIVVDGGLQWT